MYDLLILMLNMFLQGSMKATLRGEAQDFLLRTRLLEGDVVRYDNYRYCIYI